MSPLLRLGFYVIIFGPNLISHNRANFSHRRSRETNWSTFFFCFFLFIRLVLRFPHLKKGFEFARKIERKKRKRWTILNINLLFRRCKNDNFLDLIAFRKWESFRIHKYLCVLLHPNKHIDTEMEDEHVMIDLDDVSRHIDIPADAPYTLSVSSIQFFHFTFCILLFYKFGFVWFS